MSLLSCYIFDNLLYVWSEIYSHPYFILNRFVNSATYYGLTMAASDLGGDVYMSTAFNGLVEVPAGLIAMAIIDKYDDGDVSFLKCWRWIMFLENFHKQKGRAQEFWVQVYCAFQFGVFFKNIS